MKTDAEILTRLRDFTTPKRIELVGLCWISLSLVAQGGIDTEERNRILLIIKKHAPPREYRSSCHWPPGEAKPRIDWINSLLQRIKEGENL